jgi:DNA-directed RNA polymerase subunit RPC12/RpoP
MVSIPDRTLDCQRCGYKLEGGERTCPNCGFKPKEAGLRVAMGFLMLVVVSMTFTMLVPSLGPLLVRLAAVSFLLTFGTFVLAFVARPYRLGSLFVWF